MTEPTASPPEDWLPHDPPKPPPPAKSSALRTFGLWLTLVVIFIAIYSKFSSEEPRDAPLVQVGYSGWWIAVGVAVTLAAVIAIVVWLFGGAKKFNERATPGLEAIADGKLTQAAELFAQLAKQYRAKPNFAAVASYNRGYALMRNGDTAAAIGILLGVDRMPKAGAGNIRKLVRVQLGRCFALAGDVDKARRWFEAARESTASMVDPVHDRAFIDALEGLVLCREGKLEEACRHYEACWSRLLAYLPTNQMMEVWLLRAYAISASSTPRDAGGAEPWLRILRSMPPGALDWMLVRWPELATFVVTHGLATQRAA